MRLFFYLVLLPIILLAVVIGSILTMPTSILRLALDATSDVVGLDIEVGSVSIDPTGGLTIEGINISDDEGVFARANELDVAWSWGQLLQAKIDITKFDLIRPRLIRMPILPAPADDQASPGFQLSDIHDFMPLPIKLEAGRLIEAELDMLGPTPIKFKARLTADLGGPTQEVRLLLDRLEGPEAALDLRLLTAKQDQSIMAELTARDDKNGLLSTFTQLKPGKTTKIYGLFDLDPEGNIQGLVDGDFGDLGTAKGDLALNLALDEPIKADLNLTPGPVLPEEITAITGGKLLLDLALTPRSSGLFDINKANILSPSINIDLAGLLDLDGGANDLELNFQFAPNGPLPAGLALEKSEGKITVTGKLDEAFITATQSSHAITGPDGLTLARLDGTHEWKMGLEGGGAGIQNITIKNLAHDSLDAVLPDLAARAQLRLLADGHVAVDDLSANGTGLTLAGRFGLTSDNVINLTATLALAQELPNLMAGLHLGEASLKLAAHGPLTSPNIDINGKGQDLAWAEGRMARWNLEAFAIPSEDGADIKGEWKLKAQQLVAKNDAQLRLQGAALSGAFHRQAGLWVLDDLLFLTKGARVSGHGQIREDGSDIYGNLEAMIDDPQELAAIFGLEVAGEANITLNAKGDVDDLDLAGKTKVRGLEFDKARLAQMDARFRARISEAPSADIDASFKEFVFDEITAHSGDIKLVSKIFGTTTRFDLLGDVVDLQTGPDRPLLKRAEIKGKGSYDAPDLKLDRLNFKAPGLDLLAQGRLALDAEELTLSYELDLSDMKLVREFAPEQYQDVDGRIQTKGVVAGPLASLSIKGKIAGQDLRLQDRQIAQLTGAYDAQMGDELRLNVMLQAAGGLLEEKGHLNAKMVLLGNQLNIEELDTDLAGLTAKGRLDVDLDKFTFAGDLDAASQDLSLLGNLAGLNLAGGLEAHLHSQDGDEARIEVIAQNLRFEDVQLAKAHIQGDIAKMTILPEFKGQAIIAGAKTGDVTILDGKIDIAGRLQDMQASAQIRGQAAGENITAKVKAQLLERDGVRTINLSSLSANHGAQQLSLSGSSQVIIDADGHIRLDAARLNIPGGGMLVLNNLQYGNVAEGDILLERTSLGFLKNYGLPILDGNIRGRVRLGSGKGEVEFDLEEAQIEQLPKGRPANMTAKGSWDGQALRLQSNLNFGTKSTPIMITSNLPMKPDAGGLPLPDLKGQSSSRIQYDGDISGLFALAGKTDQTLNGATRIDLNIGGSVVGNQYINGQINISGGTYRHLIQGTYITNLTVNSQIIDSKELKLVLSGNDELGGMISGEALISNEQKIPELDVQLNLSKMALVRRDLVSASASGQLGLTGNILDLRLAGQISIDQAFVNLNILPPSIPSLDPVAILGLAPEDQAQENEGVVKLDINIAAEKSIIVAGRGLNSRWGMNMSVQGTDTNPRLDGQINSHNGELNFIGKYFLLEDSRVTFRGGQKIDPKLNVVLARTANGITGRIKVVGPSSDPDLVLTSTPQVPESEVLPQVVFGKSSANLSALEGILIADELLALTSGGNSTIDTIRSGLGVDVLQAEADEDGNIRVDTGKYVTQDIYVGAREETGQNRTSGVVDVDLGAGFKTEVTVDDKGGTSLGLGWSIDW
ncbi:MAG: hypothetical protein DBW67_05125 [SAR116 cluster bacterium]|nr:MAG: hypothetical protein DBW67_05125 [SAR116 cluster bacterium]